MTEIAPADRPCIVAGFDGSPASRAAIELAVRHVRDGRVIVVHAFRPPLERFGEPADTRRLEEETSRARERVRGLPDEIPGLGSVDWSYEVVDGSAAEAILTVAEIEHAAEIVIGTRGFGRARALLGSVAHSVLHGANCPVVVVPERAVARMAA